jgi:pimeloyl-ACP methyl ester carboxylesterase
MNANVSTEALSANAAVTQQLPLGDATIAYRTFGKAGDAPPLVLLQRFRGTMDHWDPELLDQLAAERQVVLFDNLGVGRSGGQTPDNVAGMADGAAAIIDALGIAQADLLGWSLGGTVVQQLCLARPGLVRRAVVAASGPGGVAEAPKAPEKVFQVASKPVSDDEDFLYLFFHDSETSRAAGRAHLRRLEGRAEPFSPPVAPEAIRAQLTAIGAWGAGKDSALSRLGEISQPVFVANGHFDRMIAAYNSYVMGQRLPDALVTLYPDSGHGFLFQHPNRFARDVLEFLAA